MGGVGSWFLGLHPVWQALIRVLLFVVPTLLAVAGIIWYERRLLSWAQDRIGPNRTGNITFSRTSRMIPGFLKGKKFGLQGILQPIADFTKLAFKEDVTPAAIDKFIYFVAPGLALFPAFAMGATLPYAPWPSLTPIANVDIGVLWVLAISSLGVYGIVLSGYASNNKYSLLGGLRSSAQLISYELGMSVSVACVVLVTGSLRMTDIVRAQEGPLWGFLPGLANWNIFTPWGFFAAVVFFICMVAETNRAPFDLPEAENELVAGYHTEYSSMKFAVFFMAEYAAMFVYGGIFATLFLGGWHLLPINWEGIEKSVGILAWPARFFQGIDYWLAPIWFVLKIFGVITVYVWLRATFPRLRYDQLMSLGWKSLLPLATLNLIIVAAWVVATRLFTERVDSRFGALLGTASAIGAGLLCFFLYKAFTKQTSGEKAVLAPRTIAMAGSRTIIPPAAPKEIEA